MLSLSAILLALPALGSAATTTCPNVDETVAACKSNGMDYQMNTRPDGCSIAECVPIGMCPRFEDEARRCLQLGMTYERYWDERQCRRARCMPNATSSSGACPMKYDEAKRKIQNCESEPGFKAIVTETSMCTTFVGCERVQSTANAEVSCRKKMEGSCVMIKCDDGFTWNSCKTVSSSSSSTTSVSSVDSDRCASIQKKATETAEELKIKRRDPDLRSLLNKLNQQLRACRRGK